MLRTKNSYMEDQRLLTSVALFRKLYDNKKDSYDVLAEFLRASINIANLWNFTVEDCSNALKNSFGFQIPSAVLKSCLRRRLKGEVELSHGTFAITENFKKSEDLQAEMSSAQEEQEDIILQLVRFAATSSEKNLTPTEEQQLREDFYHFFLGGLKPGKNHICISQFIIRNSNNTKFTEKLNHLEEGLILYQGIEYSPNTGNTNSWRSNYTIYLDTEILFWANGYDGALFQTIFKEFIDLVREINLKAADGAGINVKYFPEMKREVNSIFKAAEHIMAGGRLSDPSRTAMQHLLNGCKTPSDIVEKKGKFYALLSKYKISEEEERNYYDPSDYNCESSELLTQLASEFSEIPHEKIANSLSFFTKINFLRKGVSNKGLEQSKAIIASGKNISRQLAFHPDILQSEGATPFSTDLEYLTERLWFKLGKGFGNGRKTPAAFDVVARAQVIISTQISSKVSSEYKALIAKVKSGDMSANDASYIVIDLKSRSVRPEDLSADCLESLAHFLHVDSIEAGVRSKRILESKAEELKVKEKELDDTTRAFKAYKQENFRKEIKAWLEGAKKLKDKARRKYRTCLFLICSAPAISLAIITLLLSNSNDSLLSKAGFYLTAAAFIWIFVSPKFFHRLILRWTRASLKQNINNYAPRPKLEN